MTRETRIGLLLGLVFIIAFGLVLSELSGTADLGSGPDPRPEDDQVFRHAPVVPLAAAQRRDLAEPVARAAENIYTRQEDGVVSATIMRPREQEQAEQPSVAATVQREIPAGAVASRAPGRHSQEPSRQQGERSRRIRRAQPKRQVYVVQSGDNLTEIARKVLHDGSRAAVRKLYEANRARMDSPDQLKVGQELIVPRQVSAAARRGEPQRSEVAGAGDRTEPRRRHYREMTMDELRRHIQNGNTPTGRVYVVQAGDNLTKIARKVLRDGSRAAVRKLYEANRDRLRGPDQLEVGQELVIPRS